MGVLTRKNAEAKADEFALIDEDGSTTWGDLDLRGNRIVHALRAAGISAGDTITVIAGNRREYVELATACAQTGVLFVPANWHFAVPELAYVIADSGSRAVMVGSRFVDVASEALRDERCGQVELALVAGAEAGAGFESFEDFVASGSTAEPEDQTLGGPMFYTSGTTGHPKGVRSSMVGAGDQPAEVLELVAAGIGSFLPVGGVTALCGPIYHSAQFAFSVFPLIAGSSMVMQHRYDSAGLLDMIDEHNVTNVHLVPTQMKRLVDLPDEVRGNFEGASLEVVLHGAAPCPPEVKRRMIDWWGPIITEYYGSTEGSVISTIESQDWLDHGGSVGKPLGMFEVLVVDDAGTRLGPNEEGTLYFRNLLGSDFEYHNAPEKTADAHLEPGVFTTGDVGYLDDDGYLWLSDRKIDMIISGGVNIYPAEIEQALGGHDLVGDVAVIGVPNEEFGEEVKAIIVPNDGIEPGDDLTSTLLSFLRERIAAYKLPRTVDYVEALPRTGTGKIQKRKLREPFWPE
jgi:long-chain acyl-CoA synthetase